MNGELLEWGANAKLVTQETYRARTKARIACGEAPHPGAPKPRDLYLFLARVVQDPRRLVDRQTGSLTPNRVKMNAMAIGSPGMPTARNRPKVNTITTFKSASSPGGMPTANEPSGRIQRWRAAGQMGLVARKRPEVDPRRIPTGTSHGPMDLVECRRQGGPRFGTRRGAGEIVQHAVADAQIDPPASAARPSRPSGMPRRQPRPELASLTACGPLAVVDSRLGRPCPFHLPGVAREAAAGGPPGCCLEHAAR